MECFTGRQNLSAVAIKLNEISYVDILSLSTLVKEELESRWAYNTTNTPVYERQKTVMYKT